MRLFGKKRSDDPIDLVLDSCEVPSFSRVTLEILSRLRDPDTSMENVAEALQLDPGLIVKLRRHGAVTNSCDVGLGDADDILDVTGVNTGSMGGVAP